MKIETAHEFRKLVRHSSEMAFGYPLFLVSHSGEVTCENCLFGAKREILENLKRGAAATAINYEHNSLYCDCCQNKIYPSCFSNEESDELERSEQ